MSDRDQTSKVKVQFDVGDDDDAASRIAALLDALGFETERVGAVVRGAGIQLD